MKILILGISSNVGFNFFKFYKNKYEIIGTYRNSLLINKNDFIYCPDLNKVEEHIKYYKPNIVINAISEGNIDICEQRKEICSLLNLDFVKYLVTLSLKYNFFLIHFSSVMVYDGNQNFFYKENYDCKPLNYYGLLKLKSEQYIMKKLSNYLILRLNSVIGKEESFQRGNILSFIYKKLKRNEKLYLVDDIYTNFIFIDDLSKVIDQCVENSITGLFNVGGNEVFTRYDLGKKISEILNLKSNICNVKSSKFSNLVERPKYCLLNTTKLKNSINIDFKNIDEVIKISYGKGAHF